MPPRVLLQGFLVLLPLLATSTPVFADTLLAQFKTDTPTIRICCTTTNDSDLYAVLTYSNVPSMGPALEANALLSSVYDFTASNSKDFNAITGLLTNGINEEFFVGLTLARKAGGAFAGGGAVGTSEFNWLSGCLETPSLLDAQVLALI